MCCDSTEQVIDGGTRAEGDSPCSPRLSPSWYGEPEGSTDNSEAACGENVSNRVRLKKAGEHGVRRGCGPG